MYLAVGFNKFSDQVDFIPIYITHPIPSYDPNNVKRELNCVTKGKYCYFPKETTIIQEGQKILLEDLRQKCMYKLSKEKSINLYYVSFFLSLSIDSSSIFKSPSNNCNFSILSPS